MLPILLFLTLSKYLGTVHAGEFVNIVVTSAHVSFNSKLGWKNRAGKDISTVPVSMEIQVLCSWKLFLTLGAVIGSRISRMGTEMSLEPCLGCSEKVTAFICTP
jgi:hypothetical protein